MLAVEIKDLQKIKKKTKRSPEKIALSGINLEIKKGSFFGLLGPNGAGKSTIINILAGLVNKTSGSVKICGIDIDENTNQVVNNISVWTGIHPNEVGWSSPENLCNNWQSKSSAVMGGLSIAGGLHMGKSNWGLNWISCDAKERLFCVQQPWNQIPG